MDPTMLKSTFHGRKDSSDELDVFEASRYFAGGGYNEFPQTWRSSGGRMSLDFVSVPERQAHAHITGGGKEKRNNIMMMKENKYYKQPNSPGTRLASFLNSLFNQARKKKSNKSKSIIEDEEEKERRRRSSISHFGTSNTRIDADYAPKANSVFSNYSSSGFRTPPAVYAHTSTKILYKQNRYCISDQKQLPQKPATAGFQFRNEKVVLKDKNSNNVGTWVDGYGYNRNKVMMKKGNAEDEYDSDSSSDLFELQNYDLGVYSNSNSGGGSLPVYESTTRRSMTRGGISSAASAL